MVRYLTTLGRSTGCESPYVGDTCFIHNSYLMFINRSNTDFSQFDSGIHNPITTSMAIHGTYQLHGILEVLGVFTKEASKLYDEAMARVEPIGKSLGKILDAMPIELLSLTMEYACSSMQDLVRLSHVNRRFRSIATGLTELSSNITPSLRPGALAACLAWSGNAGLHIQLSQYQCIPFTEHEIAVKPYLDKIIPSAHRWQSLELLCANRDFLKDSSGYTEIQKRVAGLDLQSLRQLEYTYMRGYSRDDNMASQVHPSGHIYTTWKIPNLREVSFRKIVPQPFPHSITSLTLELPEHERDEEELSLHLHGVHSFLKESPSIEVLRIHTKFKTKATMAFNFPKLAMHNVREIGVRCKLDALETSAGHPLISFMRSLDVPTVSSLNIQVHLHQRFGWNVHNPLEREVNIVDTIFGLVPSNRALIRTLHLGVSSEAFSAHPVLRIPFQCLPSLRDLSLQFGGESNNICLASEMPTHASDFPTIDRLSLYGCAEGGASFLKEVVYALVRARGMEHKLCVSVRYCSSIEKAEALKYVDGDMLKYNVSR